MNHQETNREHDAVIPKNGRFHPADINDAEPFRPPWLEKLSEVEKSEKEIIGEFVAGHEMRFGTTIQNGPGTTPLAAFQRTLRHYNDLNQPLDLVVLTTSIPVYHAGLQAQLARPELFNGLKIVLTGGYVQSSTLSLVGDFAVKGICTETVRPEITISGVYGISFDQGFRVTYQFPDEVTAQEALASRPTDRRLILCTGKKLGVKYGCLAQISVESLLRNANECIIITTPPREQKDRPIFDGQITAFEKLLQDKNIKEHLKSKRLILRIINPDGTVEKQIPDGKPTSMPSRHQGAKSSRRLAPEPEPTVS